MKKRILNNLESRAQTDGYDRFNSWNQYPRPSLVRDSFINLCGEWDFCVIRQNKTVFEGEICVPFAPESPLSGIRFDFENADVRVYKKKIANPKNELYERVILHFGAIDGISDIYVNGKLVAHSENGYLPIECDITEMLESDDNELVVKVIDDLDPDYPYGKQSAHPSGMWYTSISGIWQSVWLEVVPDEYIKSVNVKNDTDGVYIELDGVRSDANLVLEDCSEDCEVRFEESGFRVKIKKTHLWSVEDPHLYRFRIESGKDVIRSYFALRTVSIENGRILLNSKPYFFNGVLDQGYFCEGIYTPATEECYKYDILKMKELGFNMLRKHIKIEPEIFYYYCDLYGMVVFQDFVNSGKYSFIYDTAFPTVGLKRLPEKLVSAKRKRIFEDAAERTVNLLQNHPCIVYYTIFNEGWGQFESDRLYEKMKALDPTRIWDSTSGWFWKNKSDVRSEHIYFKKIRINTKENRPTVLSEFGGYSYKVDGHIANSYAEYGYKRFTKRDEYQNALKALYINEILPAISDGLCACVFTQLSDVEDELNGLLTYDRKICKVDADSMNEIFSHLNRAFYEKHTKMK